MFASSSLPLSTNRKRLYASATCDATHASNSASRSVSWSASCQRPSCSCPGEGEIEPGEQEIDVLQKADTVATTCPSSWSFLPSQPPPLRSRRRVEIGRVSP